MHISIVTVCFNSAATIAETLHSVSGQQGIMVDHIVIDGGSTDKTLEIVKGFPHVAKIVSEPDNGMYDAMNKGLKLGAGDIVGILNSDDVYAEHTTLSKVALAFTDPAVDCVYGDLQYVDQRNPTKVIRNWKAGKFSHKSFLYGWMPPHPAFFVRRRVYDKVGPFNTTLKSAADYEMMLRILYKNNYTAAYIPEVLVKMRSGGVSNVSLRNRFRANREDARAWKLIDRRPYFLTLYLKPLRKLPQYLIR